MKQRYLKAFMQMTKVFALTSVSGRLQVGACLIKNGNPICFGTNGTLPGWHTNVCEDAEGATTHDVLHAEINCLNKLRKINETSVGCTLLVTHSPCLRCAHEIVDSGIETVYYIHKYRLDGGLNFLKEKGITVFQLEDE